MPHLAEMMSIDKETYYRLVRDSLILIELESDGVDNWCGYDEACKRANEIFKTLKYKETRI